MDLSLNQFIVELYRCGSRMPKPAFLNKVLATLKEWLPYQACCLVECQSDLDQSTVHFTSGRILGANLPVSAIVGHLRRASDQRPLPLVMTQSSLLSHQHHQLRQELNKWLPMPYLIFSDCESVDAQTLVIMCAETGFSDRDRMMAEWLLPHLCEALRLSSMATKGGDRTSAATNPQIGSPLEQQLTTRERQIAAELAQGLSYKEVAKSLHLSPSTVTNYANRIYRKLNVHSKTQLAHLYSWSETELALH